MTKSKRFHQLFVAEFFPKPFDIFARKPRVLIWVVINFIFFWLPSTMYFIRPDLSLILYILVLCIAISAPAEWLMRVFEDARHVATQTEKQRLLPLFNEVYERAEEHSEHISSNVKLYIIDTININAMAIGSRTIAVTRGLMETMSDEEIKGILAHEFSHISNGDTTVSILVSMATSFVFWGVMALSKLLRLLENEENTVGSIIAFIRAVLEFTVAYLLFVCSIIVSFGSRKREYIADEYAHTLGYRGQLLSALYKLYDMQISDKRDLLEKARATHPKVCFRIEKLENYT